MACPCKHTLYAVEPPTYEIRVCFSDGQGLKISDRARFALLASSWVPKPVGVLLWSALHLALLVVGGGLEVAFSAALLALSLALDAIGLSVCAIAVCILLLWGLPILLWSLATLSWSLVREGEWERQIPHACRRFANWWDPSKLPFMSSRRELLDIVVQPELKVTWTCVTGFAEARSSSWIFLRWCCEEIVHRHDTIGI